MKKFTQITLLAASLMFVFTACSKSEKGNWSEGDKKDATEFCSTNMAESFPESMKSMLDMDKFCDCFTEKVEGQYDSWSAMKSDAEASDARKIGEDCAMASLNLGGAAGMEAEEADEPAEEGEEEEAEESAE